MRAREAMINRVCACVEWSQSDACLGDHEGGRQKTGQTSGVHAVSQGMLLLSPCARSGGGGGGKESNEKTRWIQRERESACAMSPCLLSVCRAG